MLLCVDVHEYVKSRWLAPAIMIHTDVHHTNTRRAVVTTSGKKDGATCPVNAITSTETEFKRETLRQYIIYTLSVGVHARYR